MSDLLRDLIAAGVEAALVARVAKLEAQCEQFVSQRVKNAERQQRHRDRVTLHNVTGVTQRDRDLEFGSKKERKKKKHTLPKDFTLTEQRRAVARSKRGWSDDKIRQEFERLCTHARAHDRKLADWDLGWLQWVISPFQDQRGNGRDVVSTGIV